MIPKVIEAEYAQDYVIHLGFADGTEGDVETKHESCKYPRKPRLNALPFLDRRLDNGVNVEQLQKGAAFKVIKSNLT